MKKLALALFVFVSGCEVLGYVKAEDVNKPPVNVVCWQNGTVTYSAQAKAAAFDDKGYLVVDSPKDAPEGLKIKLNATSALCAVVVSPVTLDVQKPQPRPVPPKVAPSDAGPVEGDAGPIPKPAPAK